MTPTLRDNVHWLPVSERIVFIFFQTPLDHLQVSPSNRTRVPPGAVCSVTAISRRHLRSDARGDLQVLACRTSTFGPRSFATGLCPKTVELFTIVTSGSNTHTDIIL